MGRGMKAGKKPSANKGMGGGMQKQMAQMQAVQRKMEELQEEINKMETTATSGGGAVSVTVNGEKQLVDIKIKEEVVDPDDIEMLQDLILAAVNEALRKGEEAREAAMSRMAPGMGGLF